MDKSKKTMKLIIFGIIFVILIIIAIIIMLNYNKTQQNNETKSTDNVLEENLSSNELKSFSSYFNEDENNGFLLSNYENASDIDITQVFNNGAGLNEEITEAEKQEYLKSKNRTKLVTNVIVFDKTKAEELFKEKTGEKLDSIVKKLDRWIYLEKYDKFCCEKGDTNKKTVTSISGTKKSNEYKIIYKMSSGNIENNGTVTLELNDGKYLFKQNKIEK